MTGQTGVDDYIKVFVYGTLKKGFGANYKMSSGVYLSSALSASTFQIIGSGFPMAFLDAKGFPIIGELYLIPPEAQPSLDAYEGYPSFYTRDEFEFFDEDGVIHTAWMYYIPDPESYPNYGTRLKPNERGALEWRRD